MREAGVAAKSARAFRATTDSNRPHPVAASRSDRQFTPAGPDVAWVADITAIPTGEGWLDLAAVGDLFGRRIV